MRIIFEKNRINEDFIYDFKEFDGDTSFFNTLYGRIYVGCMKEEEIDKTLYQPLIFINNDTVIGLFYKDTFSDKYSPITEYDGEIIEIKIEEGEDYSQTYNNLVSEIQMYQLEIDYCKNEEEKEKLEKKKEEFYQECKGLTTPTAYEAIVEEDFEELSDEFEKDKKTFLKKMMIGTGIVITTGVCVIKFLKKLKK